MIFLKGIFKKVLSKIKFTFHQISSVFIVFLDFLFIKKSINFLISSDLVLKFLILSVCQIVRKKSWKLV